MIAETAIISALIPAGIQAVKGLFEAASRKWIGLSVDDEIKLQSASVERLKALAALDNPAGTPSQWVIDLRGSFRYIACGIFVVGGISSIFIAPDYAALGVEAALSASSFIFGERLVLSLSSITKK